MFTVHENHCKVMDMINKKKKKKKKNHIRNICFHDILYKNIMHLDNGIGCC